MEQGQRSGSAGDRPEPRERDRPGRFDKVLWDQLSWGRGTWESTMTLVADAQALERLAAKSEGSGRLPTSGVQGDLGFHEARLRLRTVAALNAQMMGRLADARRIVRAAVDPPYGGDSYIRVKALSMVGKFDMELAASRGPSPEGDALAREAAAAMGHAETLWERDGDGEPHPVLALAQSARSLQVGDRATAIGYLDQARTGVTRRATGRTPVSAIRLERELNRLDGYWVDLEKATLHLESDEPGQAASCLRGLLERLARPRAVPHLGVEAVASQLLAEALTRLEDPNAARYALAAKALLGRVRPTR